MDLFESRHRVVWDPDGDAIVLLDLGDLTLSEPTLPQTHSVQTQPYLRADWVDVWDRGGVQLRLELNVVKSYADEVAAAEGRMAHALEVAGMRHKAMSIEVGAKEYRMQAASIESAAPQRERDLGGNRVVWAYSVVCSQMEEVGAS